MRKDLKFSLFGIAALSIALSTGCNTQPDHPNQLNAFDGAAYNSLTLAHAALTSFRAQVPNVAPQYIPVFNEATAAYGAAFDVYASFRSQANGQAAVSTALASLTVGIVDLENALAAGMHADPQAAARIRQRALFIRARVKKNVTISDILSELQIAAALAATIRAGQPYSQIAAIVVEATREALGAETATAGQPIDLNTIQPVRPIQ